MNWLVCRKCGTKEWLNERTPLIPCACGSARCAEDDVGRPLLVWSVPLDPTNFDISSPPSKKEGEE